MIKCVCPLNPKCVCPLNPKCVCPLNPKCVNVLHNNLKSKRQKVK